MKALTWHGKRGVRVETVPDPLLQEPTDVIVKVTSSGICGSDLNLYELLGPFLGKGDILGHEPLGVVEELGPELRELELGDRVVVPFNLSAVRGEAGRFPPDPRGRDSGTTMLSNNCEQACFAQTLGITAERAGGARQGARTNAAAAPTHASRR